MDSFIALISTTSHLDLLGFKAHKDEKMTKASVKDLYFWEKNVVSPAYGMYKNVLLNMLRPSVFYFLMRQ